MKRLKQSDYYRQPYYNVASSRNRARYNFLMGSRGSLKSSMGALKAAYELCAVSNTSVMYIVKQKNKHASTTYKAIRNAFRKLGAYDDWQFGGSEKSTPYIYKEDVNTGRRQEILFRGVSTQEDIDKILSLEGDRLDEEGEQEKITNTGTRWVIIIDEIQTIKNDVVQTIFSKLDDSIRGDSGKMPHQFFMIGNPPKTKTHFFNRLFIIVFGSNTEKLKQIMLTNGYQEAVVEDFLGGTAHFIRTSYITTPKEWLGAPFLNKMDYYRRKSPAKFLAEGLGIFTEGAGEVFNQFDPARNTFSFADWVIAMGGEKKAKMMVTNMMKSGTHVMFENAETSFVDTLKDTAMQMGCAWLRITGPFDKDGNPDRKMGVVYRTTKMNDAFETNTYMVSDRCPMLQEEIMDAVYDIDIKESKGILQRVKENDHGLDGIEYTASGHWIQWRNSRLKFDNGVLQRPIKFVCGGDYGIGGTNKNGNGATTAYVACYTQGYRRFFAMDEFYWKNKNLDEVDRIGNAKMAIKIVKFYRDFAEGNWNAI